MSFLLSYIDEIESVRIIAGQELKSVLNGLKRDLDNPRYVYDERLDKSELNSLKDFVNTQSHLLMGSHFS